MAEALAQEKVGGVEIKKRGNLRGLHFQGEGQRMRGRD